MCFACCGAEDVRDVQVGDEESAPILVFVDSDGVVLWDIEVMCSVYDADDGPYRAEGCVFAVASVCDLLPVITVFLVAPFNGDVMNQSASACVPCG